MMRMRKILLLIMCCAFFSCATKRKIEYIDRDVVRYETKYQHDTLVTNVHDSIFHTIYQKGDTVYDIKYKYKIQYRDKVVSRYDTIYKDSIQTVFKEITTEKKVIPNWCYYSLVCWVLIIIFAIIKVRRWIV